MADDDIERLLLRSKILEGGQRVRPGAQRDCIEPALEDEAALRLSILLTAELF